jgi:Fe-S-cluster-containing dehydrogenase component
MKMSLIVNTEDCVGCHACEIACKQEHNLTVGPRLIRVDSEGPRQIECKLQLRYRVEHCRHCSSPPCQDVCAVNAISIREDGIAIIDEGLCNGCGKCIESCPFGVMQFDDVAKVARKCDLCAERLDKGLQPACAATCPSHCIYFGDKKEIDKKLVRKKHKTGMKMPLAG